MDFDGRLAGAVPGMNAGAFDMFHDAADHYLFAITQRVNVQFYGVVKESVDQNRMFRRS